MSTPIWSNDRNVRDGGVYNRARADSRGPLTCTEPGGTGTVTTPQATPRAAPARLALSECCAPGSVFADLAADAARRRDLDHRALSVRTLLHLPRVANSRGYVSRAQVDSELFFTGRQLRKDYITPPAA